jgi:hypothetical protein
MPRSAPSARKKGRGLTTRNAWEEQMFPFLQVIVALTSAAGRLENEVAI